MADAPRATRAGSEPLTLMVVHAHPDDEASSTGGILARYSAEGVRTVLVTCTDGSQGDGPGGVKPGEVGHDEAQVAKQRRRELERSCEELGVGHLELLGYRDSGMMGWPSNEAPGAFWRTPVEVAAERLVGLFDRYRPQVVVTYDPTGFYGHPDHIQAHRMTAAAFEASDIPRKLYCPTIPRSRLGDFAAALAQAGVGDGEGLPDPPEGIFVSDDDEIAAWIDCSAYIGHKLEALRAHKSQADNAFFLRLPLPVIEGFFGVEAFVRFADRTKGVLPQDDLFAGLI